MQLDVLNAQNQQVGTIEVRDDVFAGRVNTDLMWESVVHANAADRRGTHQTKNRANVSGSGKKPWRQKGTGRARVGEIRNPLWRKGGTVFGPQPRSYDYALPKKVERGALRAALADKLQQGDLIVVDALAVDTVKTKAAAELLQRLNVSGKVVLVDVAVDEKLSKSVRNIPGVSLVASGRVSARDVIGAQRLVVTRTALEKLQEALG
ncbi:MAG: 50S ribosomal protein L4 [Acidobacteria bacterium]|nr:MAG: 50S ribosomal protein L4 [Acidobacteriota bacterium]